MWGFVISNGLRIVKDVNDPIIYKGRRCDNHFVKKFEDDKIFCETGGYPNSRWRYLK